MKLLVAIEHHFQRYNGHVYTDIAFLREYWSEYLEVFDEVVVVARVKNISEFPKHLRRADGDCISFIDLPNYYGPWQLAVAIPRLLVLCFKAVKQSDYILLRMGNIATCVWFCTKILRRNYAVELVGNPFKGITQSKQTKSPAVDWLFGKVAHWVNILQARGACCASYVGEYVHHIYPTKYPDREFVFSGVRLSDELITAPRTQDSLRLTRPIIVSIGRLMAEKGHRTLVEAADKLRDLRGGSWQILIAGRGTESEPLQELIESLGLQERVKLLGVVKWGPDLFELLDNARLFVLPSLTEGMPRALIEAMAKGLPAIASRTGGISELLNQDDLVKPGDPNMLARRIDAVLDDMVQLERMSSRNFEKAMEYKSEIMREKKHKFWESLHLYSGER